MNYKDFLKRVVELKLNTIDRVIALIWYHSTINEENELSVIEICSLIQDSGYGMQNKSRIRKSLLKDRRVVKTKNDSFRISTKVKSKLDSIYKEYLDVIPLKKSDSVIEAKLFENAEPYIRKVVKQLNASYDYSLYDCCAVMSRRLLETLIIEAYEKLKREDVLKNGDGNYFMFSGLIKKLENDNKNTFGRETLKGLKKFKKLGDNSAHNRRFNARKKDIDDIKDELRIPCEDLLHLSHQSPS